METIWKSERVPGEPGISVNRAGDGPDPVICLHGITAQHRAFTAAARRVGPVRGLAGVDLRGRGDSDKPDSGYGLEAHANDVVRVLDHLGLEQATMAGHSMGAFVAIKTALMFPGRVRALVLLDGGWPRTEVPLQEDMTEEQRREAEAIREGLARAFSRLDMVFETPDDYLNFWFPDQNLTMKDLPPDLADYYRYDLQKVEGGYNPKCSSEAAKQDSPSVTKTSPTIEEMRAVGCPVALVRASEGFFPGSRPLIPDETRDAMAGALDIRAEMVLPGANHYTMMWPPYTRQWDDLLRSDEWYR
ncbi:alpha/beta fold hydrolase [Rubrobacter tropicus]|uniref:Alpha/beta fold hydrolase n=1 Tax=Rubrobacter tropicus TaxID=2653851 RepID=A0A6G8Q4M2_9ACTN|nr:alpha/beta hydrolase [Rubrobacter tropicus]QIN81444.1 alpha/beta fold hydrolase [Rubrobacter tropicus]